MTWGCPFETYAQHEFVVPRSIPIAFPIAFLSERAVPRRRTGIAQQGKRGQRPARRPLPRLGTGGGDRYRGSTGGGDGPWWLPPGGALPQGGPRPGRRREATRGRRAARARGGASGARAAPEGARRDRARDRRRAGDGGRERRPDA